MKKILLYILLLSATIVNAQFVGGHGALWKAAAGGVTLKTNLISVWELDETSGATATDEHGTNNGTNFGATINQTGIIDKAYDYTGGTTERVELTTGLFEGNAESSVSVWFKVDNTSGTKGIVTQWYDGTVNKRSVLIRLSNASLQFYTYTTSQVGGTYYTVSTATWYHVVCVYNGSTMRIYVDGTLDGTSFSQTGNLGAGTDHVGYVGNYYTATATTLSHDGLIDQVAIWDRALTQTDVDDLYNSGSGLAYSGW